MKVRVSLIVDVDTEAWTTNYGVEGDRAIRADVREYVKGLVTEQLSNVQVLGEDGVSE